MADRKPIKSASGILTEFGSGDTVAVANGGTGQTTLATAVEALLAALSATQGVIPYRASSAWSALAAGTAGQFLKTNGAGANPEWSTLPLIVKQKTADEDVASSNTLQNDDDISFPIGANENWAALHIGTHYNLGGSTVGARWKWTGPSGYSGRLTSWGSTPILFLNDADITVGYHVPFTGVITSDPSKLFVNILRVTNGGNAGTMQFQFCQDTSNSNAYRMRRGGILIAAKL